MDDKQYIQRRLKEQQAYHSKTSSALKKKLITINTISMSLSAAIPVFTCLVDTCPFAAKIIIASLGGVITVLTGYLSVSRINVLFAEYRMVSEKLKSIEYLYETKSPPYDNEYAFRRLVIDCESIIGSNNDKWYSLIKTESEKNKT